MLTTKTVQYHPSEQAVTTWKELESIIKIKKLSTIDGNRTVYRQAHKQERSQQTLETTRYQETQTIGARFLFVVMAKNSGKVKSYTVYYVLMQN